MIIRRKIRHCVTIPSKDAHSVNWGSWTANRLLMMRSIGGPRMKVYANTLARGLRPCLVGENQGESCPRSSLEPNGSSPTSHQSIYSIRFAHSAWYGSHAAPKTWKVSRSMLGAHRVTGLDGPVALAPSVDPVLSATTCPSLFQTCRRKIIGVPDITMPKYFPTPSVQCPLTFRDCEARTVSRYFHCQIWRESLQHMGDP